MDRSPFLIVRAAALGLIVAGALRAQTPPPAGNPFDTVVLGANVFGGQAWDEVARLPGTGWELRPERRADGTIAVGASVADPAVRHVLTPLRDAVQLVHLQRGLLWSRPLAELGIGEARSVVRAWLTPERVVLPRADGGVIGLDRATGKTVWRREGGSNSLLRVDSDLVLTAGPAPRGFAVRALALANGARAFDVAFADAPTAVVAASHGIAVVFADRLVVLDRSGPELFARRGPVESVVGTPDGFFVLAAGTAVALDRLGNERWRVPVSAPSWQRVALAADAAGHLLIVFASPFADDGALVSCSSRSDGAHRWHRQLEPLGVDHSKYWQEVRVRAHGDSLLVVSDGAAGQWAAELQADDGAVRRRAAKSNR